MYVNHPLLSRLNLVLMSNILTNFLVHLTVIGRVRGRQYVLIVVCWKFFLLKLVPVCSLSANNFRLWLATG